MNTRKVDYKMGVLLKDSGGIFLTWTKIRLAVVVIFFIILGVFLAVLLATPECKCSLEDIQAADGEAFWNRCVDTAILRNESFNCETPPEKNYRLPGNLLPQHYNIELKIDFYYDSPDNFTYEGHVDMFLDCVEATDVIKFHIGSQEIKNIDVVNGNVSFGIRNMSYSIDTEVMEVLLDNYILVGDQVVVSIDYFTSDTLTRGVLYNSYWDNDTDSMQYLVASHFQPYDARQAFPCLDEPIFKSTFNITLWRQQDYTALANTPLQYTESNGDGWYKDHFEETPVSMSVYLVCFVISKYDYISDTADGGLTPKPIRYFSDPESVRQGYLEYAKSLGGKIFDWLELTLDEPYAMPKLDMVALNNFTGGGMENWGLVVYMYGQLVMNPDDHQIKSETNIPFVMAHELAHMWLGNLVTVKWWEDIWLQEGFAHFFAREALIHVLGDWDYEDQSVASDYLRTALIDSSGSSHPLHHPVSTRDQTLGVFSSISYVKGRIIIRMIRETIGHDTFLAGVQNYIDEMKYKSVDTNDLLSVLEKQLAADGINIGTNFTEFILTWIEQIGYPVITFHRQDGISSDVEVTQHIFLRDEDASLDVTYPSKHKYSWTVPITYITSQTPDWTDPQRTWLVRDNRSITLPSKLGVDDWLLGNVKLYGFYRVNYDRLGWEAIITQLNTDHTVFPALNRAQLIEDAFSFYTARLPPITLVDAFRLTQYLPNELEYPAHMVSEKYVWGFDTILQDTPAYAYFRMYVQRWIKPHYERLGWDDHDGDSITTRKFRRTTIKLACQFDIGDCVKEARRRYTDYEDHGRRLDPDLANGIRCLAVQYGSEADWETVLNQYLDGQEGYLYAALACTQKPWLISRYLETFSKPEEEVAAEVVRDRSEGLSAIARNPVARPMIWTLMAAPQWGDWMEDYRVAILNTLAIHASTQDKLDETVSILERGSADLSKDVERLSEVIESNIRWREEYMQEITEWFKKIVF